MKNMRKFISAALLLLGVSFASAQENVYVFKDNAVMFHKPTKEIDRVALEEEKTKVSVRDTEGNVLYSAALEAIDSVVIGQKPVADLLDVVFREDGSATDLSPMANAIEAINNNGKLSTYYNEAWGRYVARFDNEWAGDNADGYYKMDYSKNTEFKNALADGHTLEMVIMPDYEPSQIEQDTKPFSSHQGGGTGLGTEVDGYYDIMIHTGGNWHSCNSHVASLPQVYRHVVGVWNKDEGKARIYVDGELKDEVDAAGDFKFPNADSNWFGIGGDPNKNKADFAFRGDIVLARIHDAPLTQQDVTLLWDDVADRIEHSAPDTPDQE